MPMDAANGLARILTRHAGQFRGLHLGMTIEEIATLEGKQLELLSDRDGERVYTLERTITKAGAGTPAERDKLVVTVVDGRASEISYFLMLDSKDEVAAIFKSLIATLTERFGKGTKDGAFIEYALPPAPPGPDARLWTGKYPERTPDGAQHVIKIVVDPQ